MLVLTRKEREALLIGKDIEVTVLAVRGNQVRLGITCPDDTTTIRKELTLKQPVPAASNPGPSVPAQAAGPPASGFCQPLDIHQRSLKTISRKTLKSTLH